MKETLICSFEKHSIYYLSNMNLGFYIMLPNNNIYNETNISIRLKSNYQNYDLNINSLEQVTNELINYYKDMDNYNITLILPVFYNDLLMRIRTVDDMESYLMLDKYLGQIFNEAFNFLSKNNIKVNNNIFVINNESFKRFTDWFVARYNNRIEYKTIAEMVKQNDDFNNYNIIETPNINFVVSKNEIPDLNKTAELEVETFDDFVDKNDSENDTKQKNSNSGFVSYVLLGVISLVVSLTLLYLLVK